MAEFWQNMNWSSQATEGRNRANREKQNQMQVLNNELQINAYERKIANDIEQEFNYTLAQAREVSRHYRPKDKKRMQDLEQNSLNKIKLALESSGDDVVKFMNAGGRNLINEYKESILGSDEAKIIKANHKNIAQFLEQMKSNPQLVSRADRQGWENWRSGKVDAFIYQGAYMPYKEIEEDDLKRYKGNIYARENALLDKDMGMGEESNMAAIIHNMRIDHGLPYNIVGENAPSRGEMINYLHTNYFRDKPIGAKQQEILRGYPRDTKSITNHLEMINNQWNRHFTGDFGEFGENFWKDPENFNAFDNLSAIGGAQPVRSAMTIPGKKSFGRTVFEPIKGRMAALVFEGDTEKDANKNSVNLSEIRRMISTGSVQVFDNEGNYSIDGKTLPGGEPFNRNFDVMSIEYGFEVDDIDENGNVRPKILTLDDVSQEGDSSALLKNKTKRGVMYFVLRDAEAVSFRRESRTGFTKRDKYVYVKVDPENNPLIGTALDKMVGDINYTSKSAQQSSPGTYVYKPNEKFSWDIANTDNAVKTLQKPLYMLRKDVGVEDTNVVFDSVILAHALQEAEYKAPSVTIRELGMSKDPVVTKAINKLKEGDIQGYINAFREAPDEQGNAWMSDKEAVDLIKNYRKILGIYNMVGSQYSEAGKNEKGETQYDYDSFYDKF
jgi:hypothetical protein